MIADSWFCWRLLVDHLRVWRGAPHCANRNGNKYLSTARYPHFTSPFPLPLSPFQPDTASPNIYLPSINLDHFPENLSQKSNLVFGQMTWTKSFFQVAHISSHKQWNRPLLERRSGPTYLPTSHLILWSSPIFWGFDWKILPHRNLVKLIRKQSQWNCTWWGSSIRK